MGEPEESVFTSLAINASESELYDYHLHTKILITAPYKQLKYRVANDLDIKFRCLYSGKRNMQMSIT